MARVSKCPNNALGFELAGTLQNQM